MGSSKNFLLSAITEPTIKEPTWRTWCINWCLQKYKCTRSIEMLEGSIFPICLVVIMSPHHSIAWCEGLQMVRWTDCLDTILMVVLHNNYYSGTASPPSVYGCYRVHVYNTGLYTQENTNTWYLAGSFPILWKWILNSMTKKWKKLRKN